jgi:enoyl-CoA hydratase/carnithine racemase
VSRPEAAATGEGEVVVSGASGDPVVLIRLNRPRRLNALSATTVDALQAALDDAVADGRRAVVLTGTGRAFCSGFDLRQEANEGGLHQDGALRQLEAQQRLGATLMELPLPVIAAINGLAVGAGCEIALACDFVLAAADAQLSLPEVRIGSTLGGGSSYLLPRTVGRRNASELVLLGEQISAEEAQRMGIVSRVVEPERLLPAALELGARLASRPPHAIAAIKAALLRGLHQTFAETLESEVEEMNEANAHPDSAAIVEHFRKSSTYGDGAGH